RLGMAPVQQSPRARSTNGSRVTSPFTTRSSQGSSRLCGYLIPTKEEARILTSGTRSRGRERRRNIFGSVKEPSQPCIPHGKANLRNGPGASNSRALHHARLCLLSQIQRHARLGYSII